MKSPAAFRSPARLRSEMLLRVAMSAIAGFAASSSFAEDAPPAGAGTRAPAGSKVNAEIGNIIDNEDDADVYEFDGYAGQTATIQMKRGKVGSVLPEITLYRPDGTEVFPEDGIVFKPAQEPSLSDAKSRKATFALDASGVWTVRLRGGYASVRKTGDDPATPDVEDGYIDYDFPAGRRTGTYSYSIKLTPYTGTKAKNVAMDANRQFVFAIPSSAGGVLSASMKWSGAAPQFLSANGPDGRALPGFSGSVSVGGTSATITPYTLPVNVGAGNTVLTFLVPPGATPPSGVSFTSKFTPSRSAPKAVKTTFDKEEPFITQINPAKGGPGTVLTVIGGRLFDSGASGGSPRLRLGRDAYLENVTVSGNNTSLQGVVPSSVPETGDMNVVLESSAGQAYVLGNGFRRVPPPTVTSIDPVVGPDSGGFTITISGEGFDTTPGAMAPMIDGFEIVVNLGSIVVTPTTFSFTMGSWPAGTYSFGLKDKTTGLSDSLGINSFQFTAGAAISRVTPGLIPVTGLEVLTVSGANFANTDRIWLENSPGAGTYTEMATTFLDSRRLQFTAPARTKGTYRVFVRNSFNVDTPTRTFAYYTLSDFSGALGLPGGADSFDAVVTALADIDRDGDQDLVLSRSGGTGVSTTPHTRVLRNDGTGALTDVTSGTNGVMPTPLADDDWRADGMRCVDVNQDGYPDLVLVTNSATVPGASKSHLRFLVNESRTGTSGATDRVFRDRTSTMAPPIRAMSTLYGGGTTQPWNWHAWDVWVGDIDAAAGVPEVLITSDSVKEDRDVSCTPYCSSPFTQGYTYNFYWGGSAAFVWDKNANSGQGRYKYDLNFFPRKSGVAVPIFGAPPGVTIPSCTGGSCRGAFTPFTGQKLAVGSLNGDAKPDVAVINRNSVSEGAGSPLQVAINQFDSSQGIGVQLTDLSDKIGSLSGNFTGNAIAIGQTGYPNGAGVGFVAVAKSAAPASGLGMRLFKYVPPTVGQIGDFQEVTTQTFPASTNDKWQSSAIRFIDIDSDGDQDMISVADAAPAGTEPAIRLWTNEVVSAQVGIFREKLKPLTAAAVTATNYFEGACLSIGDLDNDGGLEFVVTRAGAPGTAPHTRALSVDK